MKLTRRAFTAASASAIALTSISTHARANTLRMGHDQPAGSMFDEGYKMFKTIRSR